MTEQQDCAVVRGLRHSLSSRIAAEPLGRTRRSTPRFLDFQDYDDDSNAGTGSGCRGGHMPMFETFVGGGERHTAFHSLFDAAPSSWLATNLCAIFPPHLGLGGPSSLTRPSSPVKYQADYLLYSINDHPIDPELLHGKWARPRDTIAYYRYPTGAASGYHRDSRAPAGGHELDGVDAIRVQVCATGSTSHARQAPVLVRL